MTQASREFNVKQKRSILRTGKVIRARRKALGLTQVQLEFHAAVPHSTVEAIERTSITHRSPLPSDPRVTKVFDALTRLEKDHTTERFPVAETSRRALSVARKIRRIFRTKRANEFKVVLHLCPDQAVDYNRDGADKGLWITQAGCEAMRKTNATCKARENGLPCRGVDYRRGLSRKTIPVVYTPPKPTVEPANKLRAEDWR